MSLCWPIKRVNDDTYQQTRVALTGKGSPYQGSLDLAACDGSNPQDDN